MSRTPVWDKEICAPSLSSLFEHSIDLIYLLYYRKHVLFDNRL